VFCEPSLYEKFGFEDFFRDKMVNADAVIKVADRDNGNAQLALKCLQVLNGQFDDKALRIIDYCHLFVDVHLKNIEDFSVLDVSLKSEIGLQIMQLLTLKSSFMEKHAHSSMWMWGDDEMCGQMVKFLGDGAVRRRLTEEERSWVKAHTNPAAPERDILETVTKDAARKWLGRKSTAHITGYFKMVLAYLNKVNLQHHS
jgi:hypothetical protein